MWRISRLTRDGTAKLVSWDQIFRRERGQGNIHVPCSFYLEQDCQPNPFDPCSAIPVIIIHYWRIVMTRYKAELVQTDSSQQGTRLICELNAFVASRTRPVRWGGEELRVGYLRQGKVKLKCSANATAKRGRTMARCWKNPPALQVRVRVPTVGSRALEHRYGIPSISPYESRGRIAGSCAVLCCGVYRVMYCLQRGARGGPRNTISR